MHGVEKGHNVITIFQILRATDEIAAKKEGAEPRDEGGFRENWFL